MAIYLELYLGPRVSNATCDDMLANNDTIGYILLIHKYTVNVVLPWPDTTPNSQVYG